MPHVPSVTHLTPWDKQECTTGGTTRHERVK